MFQHFVDGHSDPVPASPFDRITPSRKRRAERSAATDNSAVKRSLIKTSAAEQMCSNAFPQFGIIKSVTTSETVVPHSTADTCVLADESKMFVDKSVQTESYNTFIETILSSDKMCFYYTGLPTVELLKYLFEWIEPAAHKTKLWDGARKHIPGRKGGRRRNKFFQEYIFCLVKIRHGYGSQHLAYLFNISVAQVCRVFSTWVNLLDQCLKPLLIWPSTNIVKANLPAS